MTSYPCNKCEQITSSYLLSVNQIRFLSEVDNFCFKFHLNLCLVLLKPVKTALMLWLHGNDSILRAAIFLHLHAYVTNITNVIQLWEVE